MAERFHNFNVLKVPKYTTNNKQKKIDTGRLPIKKNFKDFKKFKDSFNTLFLEKCSCKGKRAVFTNFCPLYSFSWAIL